MVDWTDDVEAAAAIHANIETDLADEDLGRAARAAVSAVAGQVPFGSLSKSVDGGERYIFLSPPATELTTVTEWGVELTDGFQLAFGGRAVERVAADGVPLRWGRTTVEYERTLDPDAYDAVILDLVRLALQYSALSTVRSGDYSEEALAKGSGDTAGAYEAERRSIIGRLNPSWGFSP